MFRSKSKAEDIREVRSHVSDFCRQRRIPEPSNFSEDQLRAFHKYFVVESRTQVGWHGTRNGRLRASGTSDPAPEGTTVTTPAGVSDIKERDQRHRRALAALA